MSNIIDATKQAFEQGFAPIRISRRLKVPIEKGWQTNAIVRDETIAFQEADNLGLACGFNGLVAIDVDKGGEDALNRVLKHLGQPVRRIGRANAPNREKWIYRQTLPECPAELIKAARDHQQHGNDYNGSAWPKDKQTTYKPYADLLKAFIRNNGLISTEYLRDEIGLIEPESYEIKSFGAQIVIPPSIHASGADVVWIGDQGLPTPEEWAAATPITPDMIKALRFEVTGKEEPEPRDREEWTGGPVDIRLAVSALRAIPNGPDVSYETYRDIAFALNAIDPESDELLAEFEAWAAQYPEHVEGDAEPLWEAASPDGGIGPGTLFYRAAQAGWDRAKAEFEITGKDIIDAETDIDKLKSFYPTVAAVQDATYRELLATTLANRIGEINGGPCKQLVKTAIKQERQKIAAARASQRRDIARVSEFGPYPVSLKLDSAEGIVFRPDPNAQRNVEHLISGLGVSFHYDIFRQQVCYEYMGKPGHIAPIDQQLSTKLYDIAHNTDFRVNKYFFGDQIRAIASRVERDPVRDYIGQLPEWDGKERLNTAFKRHMGAPDTPSVGEILELMLRAIIRRTFRPGAKFDLMPILEGKQGKGKSEFFRVLMPDPEWYAVGPRLDVDEKRLLQHLGGKLIVEFAELAGIRKTDMDRVKNMITRQIDVYIPNHEREEVRAPRRCVLVGTVNDAQYLRDLDDNRRFPIVPVTKELDQRALAGERDQLWAEALWAEQFGYGEQLRLSEAGVSDMKAIQSTRYDIHPEAEQVLDDLREFECGYLDTETIWMRLGCQLHEREKRAGQIKHVYNDVKRSMEREGWEWRVSIKVRDGDKTKVRTVIRKGGVEGNRREIVCNGITLCYLDEVPE